MKTLVAIILFFPAILFGQRTNLKFQHITPKEGLSQSNVLCILQDSRGFMWFGTREGLNKYDGYKFKVYKKEKGNNLSLTHNTVTDIVEDRDGNLWVSTIGGLSFFDWEKEKFTQFKHDDKDPNSIAGNVINALWLDSRGDLWIGIENVGLDLYDRKHKKFIHYKYDRPGLANPTDFSVKEIYEDRDNNLWIGTGWNGVLLFNKKDNFFRHYQNDRKKPKSIAYGAVLSIFQDSKGRIWLGTRGEGLNLFHPESSSFTHYQREIGNENSLAHNIILSLQEDDRGKIWVGTENGGLSILDPETGIFENYRQNEFDDTSLSNNSIYSIYKDPKGSMWLGTFSGGINFVDRVYEKFKHYTRAATPEGLSHSNVLSIFENAEGKLLIGTDGGGLNVFDRKTLRFTYFKHEDGNKKSISGNAVLSAIEDSQGNVWVGAWGEGLTVFNPKTQNYRFYRYDLADTAGLGSFNPWIIFEDSEKKVWVGTYGSGLELFNPETNGFIHYKYDANNPHSISGNVINYIFEDSKGSLWIGNNSDGLNRFDKKTKKFSRFLPGISVNSIKEDHLGNLYLGTDDGLKYLNTSTGKIIEYGLKDGLPNDMVFGILEDDKRNIWISTNNGLSRFTPKTGKFKNYTEADGLQSNEFRKGFLKTRDGWMYFGGINGFNEFFPDSVKERRFDPPLVITDFEIFNESVPIASEDTPSPLKKNITATEELTLSYKQSVISFEFASLNYTSIEKKKYAYMLRGFDKKWNEVGIKNSATYTNLDPGEYLLLIKGLDNAGNWSRKMANLRIVITPPFWGTWWFRAVIVMVILGSFGAFYFIRIRVISNQKKLLERMVTERTREVVAQKEEIQLQKENIEEKNQMLERQFEEITAQNDQILQQNDKLEEAKKEIKDKNEKLKFFNAELGSIVRERTRQLRKAFLDIEQTNKELDQFIYRSAHDLRGPVARIKGLCNLGLLHANGQSKMDELLPLLFNCTDEMNNKLARLMKIHEINSLEIHLENIDFDELLRELLQEVFIEQNSENIQVTIDIDRKEVFRSDKYLVRILLKNVLENAVKYKDDRKPNCYINIRVAKNEKRTEIIVEDNGIGIPKDQTSKIFDMFVVSHEKIKGFGLGLYEARLIARRLHGTIDVNFPDNGNTQFRIII